jgi:hypothetical protein
MKVKGVLIGKRKGTNKEKRDKVIKGGGECDQSTSHTCMKTS